MDYINEIETFLGIENTERHSDYICVLTGQFSSGKSKFLNNLIGEEYLPVGTREMTTAPTFIKKGKDEAFVFCNNEKEKIEFSDIKKYKKGSCSCDRIEISFEGMDVPKDLIFVDTPGTNSISFGKCESEINRADAVLYFLTKSLSAEDVKNVDDICLQKETKLIFIRTRIDDIKKAEEDIAETYEEEKRFVQSFYPQADFYFVSLCDPYCENNQISKLMSYVKYDLKNVLCIRRTECMKDYIAKELFPLLSRMKNDIEIKAQNLQSENLSKRTQRQLKEIRRNIGAYEYEMHNQSESAKKNYINNGTKLIEQTVCAKGYISSKEMQAYVLDCIHKFEEWYKLELEDISSNVPIADNKNLGENQKLIPEDVISKVFGKFEKSRSRFSNFTMLNFSFGEDTENENRYEDISQAKSYLKRIFDSVFLSLSDNLSDNYSKRIETIIKDLSEQYKREDELIQQYAVSGEESIKKIECFMMGLEKYGTNMEIT